MNSPCNGFPGCRCIFQVGPHKFGVQSTGTVTSGRRREQFRPKIFVALRKYVGYMEMKIELTMKEDPISLTNWELKLRLLHIL
jgi:hypothetical protein